MLQGEQPSLPKDRQRTVQRTRLTHCESFKMRERICQLEKNRNAMDALKRLLSAAPSRARQEMLI